MDWNRRRFIELSSAAFAAACAKPALGQATAPQISNTDATIRVQTSHYSFTYTRANDTFTVFDAKGRMMVKSPLQPVVLVAGKSTPTQRKCRLGKVDAPQVSASRIAFRYTGVNGDATISFALRFDERGFWIDPIVYESSTADDVVSVHYFVNIRAGKPSAAMLASVFIAPGIAEGPAVSTILGRNIRLNETLSLGHTGVSGSNIHQQWGLPVHYFCGFSTKAPAEGRRNTYTEGRSDAFVCGLADMPSGDLRMDMRGGYADVWLDYRSDLWHHLHTPGKLTLGSTWCFAFGANDYEAIGAYYSQLVDTGAIKRKNNSPAKNAAVLAPQFCTWGAQVDRAMEKDKLTEAFLETLYAELKASGMKATLFSIDDKWENSYGTLKHSVERFPHFEQFLDKVRAEGHTIGIWAAFMRCEDPAALGLEPKHMLQGVDGKPYKSGGGTYYILDFTHPEVEKVLTDHARQFIRTYKPALVKFDFGYELPPVDTAVPFDRSWAGERVLQKGLDIIVRAMRQENPDLAIMYYQLSPLFMEHFDLHSTDDLYCAAGDYDIEANRRIYYASALSQLGIPTYGSTGYDWSSAPVIWFDSVAAGTLGFLNDIKGDEFAESATPEQAALFNGLVQTLRTGNLFTIVPFPRVRPEASIRGAHARSWARIEDGNVTLIAQRPPSFDDGDGFEHGAIDSRVDGILTTTAPVVVASKTADGITTSHHLAVVAATAGTVLIRRKGAGTAHITTHHFGGATTQSTATISNGKLALPLKMVGLNGKLIEWTEVKIS